MSVTVLPLGERALLLEVASLPDVLALHAVLAASRIDGVLDLVPAARTVMVVFDPHRVSVSVVRSWAVGAADAAGSEKPALGPLVELKIVYDGADLAETAAVLGVTVGDLVARHAGAEWTVAFTGFAPGFGYLVSDEWPFDVPRLDVPRTRVPAGAVGLAAGFTGAYPRETPGGWRLIGTTAAPLFDPDASSPALLAPGTRVRFRPAAPVPAPAPDPVSLQLVAETAGGAHALGDRLEAHGRGQRGVAIVEPGLLATVQDLGRPGAASLGVAPSGALDRGALRTANRLVGNPEHLAGLEVTMGGFRAVAAADLWIAVTGAWGRVTLDGREIDPYEAHAWRTGTELHLDWFAHGARAYLALRGGVESPAVLGSRSTDVMAGIGPARLTAGDTVVVGPAPKTPIPVVALAPWGAPHDEELEVDLAPGPRADWFAASALETLYDAVWTVSNSTDRVGMRLDGPALERVRTGELPSEGMVPGALQVPPSGGPVILGRDGPVTGGYPVIAVATDAALDLLAQARPGARIRFRHARRGG
ncbi:urea amidolyase family protein [Planococcus sp. APC 4015]|nr:urea amidolyase family protein [Planococcus sp. APC 4015]